MGLLVTGLRVTFWVGLLVTGLEVTFWVGLTVTGATDCCIVGLFVGGLSGGGGGVLLSTTGAFVGLGVRVFDGDDVDLLLLFLSPLEPVVCFDDLEDLLLFFVLVLELLEDLFMSSSHSNLCRIWRREDVLWKIP